MELSASSPKERVISPPECTNDAEEPEISEDDDDDRNHKHRRREARSQSMEQDSSDQVLTRPYRKNNRHFENGNSFHENEKRHQGAGSIRAQFDSNKRMISNQTFPWDSGSGRGRGRDYGSWNQRDSRFNPADLSSHMVQVGSMAPGIFGGRGLSGVSTAPSAPWPAFGLLPGVPTGGPIGLQASLRPPLNSSLNVGIPWQRCRDFEERGFCLRGDMCPLEHGINRIVVDDVQSLSQFNLPVSLPGPPLMPASSNTVPPHFGSSSTFLNSKGANVKNSKGGIAGDDLGYGDTYPDAVGADFYDPDQPLWNSNAGETSGGLLNSHGVDKSVATLDDGHQDGTENACGVRNSKSSGQSGWGRSQAQFKEKADAALSSSEDQNKEGSISSSRQGKQILINSTKAPNDARRHAQKAMQTLFVNGVPRAMNKKELLLGHFKKFGKVVDIHIPLNSEKAFVQFSKREDAENALKAPDAVMGNRFIKLWWANRDNILDNGLASGNGSSMAGRGVISAATSRSNHVSIAPKGLINRPAEAFPSSDEPKVAGIKSTKIPPEPKKSESLEQLKEELRKKQEMLEQKRSEFRKQLAKLEKHATVVKGEEGEEHVAKRLKVSTSADLSGPSPSPKPEPLANKSKPTQKSVSTTNPTTDSPLQESKTLKQRTYPFAASKNTPMVNRYKLDNRSTTIKVVPPLPTELYDVAALKEHFTVFGEIAKVELEDEGSSNGAKDLGTSNKNITVCVTFVKRSAAEKAIANGRYWQGHTLQLAWVTQQPSKETARDTTTVYIRPNGSDNSSSSALNAKDTSMPMEESDATHVPQEEASKDNTSDKQENEETCKDDDCDGSDVKEAAGADEEEESEAAITH